MNDLVKAFFERDLTEAEKDALGEVLENSPEETAHFMELGASKYAATGLPQPRWPGGGGGLALPASVKVLGTVLIVGGVGFLALKGLDFFCPKEPLPVVAEAPVLEKTSLPAVDPSSSPVPAKAAVRVTPERFVEGKRYSGLLAVVDKAVAAPAEVRVVDGEGRVVCRLFEGTLEKGTWVFRWDGRTETGALTDPGGYTIEVLTSDRVLRQPVTLK